MAAADKVREVLSKRTDDEVSAVNLHVQTGRWSALLNYDWAILQAYLEKEGIMENGQVKEAYKKPIVQYVTQERFTGSTGHVITY